MGLRRPKEVGSVLILTVLGSFMLSASEGRPERVEVTRALAPPLEELTGADIEAALEGPCQEKGGCTLGLQEGTYSDVQLHICLPHRSKPDCIDVKPGSFPRGIVLEGAGRDRTRLHSPVPVLTSRSRSASVVWVDPAGLDLPFFAARGFTIDGRSNLQPSPVVGDAKGARSAGARHFAFRFVSASNAGTEVRIENVAVEDMMSRGVIARQMKGGWIRNSSFTRMGCWQDTAKSWFGSEVKGEIPCGCDSPDAGENCAGWEDERDGDGGSQLGVKTVGLCATMTNGDAGGFVIEGNECSYASKIGFNVTTQPGSQDPQFRGLGRNVTIRNNKVRKARTGVTCNACSDVDVIDNEFTDIGLNGTVLEAGACMAAGRSAVSRLRYIGNTCRGAMGEGIRIGGNGTGVEIRDNVIENVCRQCEAQGFEGRGIRIRDNDRKGEVLRDLRVSGNVVRESPALEYGLYVRHWDDVVIQGGRYEGGRKGAVLLDDLDGLDLEGIHVDGGPLVIGKDVRGKASRCTYSKGASLRNAAEDRVSLSGC